MKRQIKCWGIVLVSLSLVLAVLPGRSQEPSKDSRSSGAGTSDVPKIAFEKYTLSNGLQVILHVDRKLPMVHVNNWYHVNSRRTFSGTEMRRPKTCD